MIKIKCSKCGIEMLRSLKIKNAACFPCKRTRRIAYRKVYDEKRKI
jgi:hypothetical protein